MDAGNVVEILGVVAVLATVGVLFITGRGTRVTLSLPRENAQAESKAEGPQKAA